MSNASAIRLDFQRDLAIERRIARAITWPIPPAPTGATIEFNVVLVTGDPAIELLEGEPNLRVEWLRKILTTRSTLVITSSGTSRSRLPRS